MSIASEPNCVQATQDCALRFVLAQVPGAPGAERSAKKMVIRIVVASVVLVLTAGCASVVKKEIPETSPPALTNSELENWNYHLQKKIDELKGEVAALRAEHIVVSGDSFKRIADKIVEVTGEVAGLHGEYVVVSDDSFRKIAGKFGLSVDELKRLNPGVDRLIIGHRLKIR